MSATTTRVSFVRILHSSIGFDRLITVSPIPLPRLTLALEFQNSDAFEEASYLVQSPTTR
ncbi:unnamed protein product [Sphenostylis stenocarpa]|uniref:Uncharacterized protein n=1 Tax=Sphenostylis stenocarpa TaxID=92480 RepID=A0AA86VW05_9FABA|nr:unnamed protein product [Sphenostylis stenocarpa]